MKPNDYHEIVKQLGLRSAFNVELAASGAAGLDFIAALSRQVMTCNLPPLVICHCLRQLQAHMARRLLGDLAPEANATFDQIIAEAIGGSAAAPSLSGMKPQGHA
jgi:hypothetical protein